MNHQNLNEIISRALNEYFCRVQLLTNLAVLDESFNPATTANEDAQRFTGIGIAHPEMVMAPVTVPMWRVIRGLPETLDGSLLARRRVARQARRVLPDVGFVFEVDDSGRMVFTEPFSSQQTLKSFEFEFRDYFRGPKERRSTVLSDCFIGLDDKSTQMITVAQPVFDDWNRVSHIVCAAVSNDMLRERVFEPLRAASDEGVVYSIVDRHGHRVASTRGRQDYLPVAGSPTDEGDMGNVRAYGPLRSVQWLKTDFEAGTEWQRSSATWDVGSLKASYSDEYDTADGTRVFGTFAPISLISDRDPRYGIVIETPAAQIYGQRGYLYRMFIGASVALAVVLVALGRAIWRYTKWSAAQLADMERSTRQRITQVSHDIRSPITTLLAFEVLMGEQPEHLRTMYRDAVVRVEDIANELLTRTS
jgi:hypothetical protein